ncbi:AraC family ligand binding domain-containing protein [Streptococcus suis]|uniref:AraC family ligand binding domain-containing protein n=1 Tax=Streptococcus suis TaxID=1307 RepID=UPI000CF706C3|nr:AraC family ligand binding domain-containing protein [Streptococcus suis]
MQQMLHHYHNNILQLDDVYFSFCGVSITQPGHSFGPAIRNDFLIHIVIDGEGTLLSDNQLYHLKANQGFLIEPKVPNFYQSSNTNPWKYLWIGFNGEKVPDLLQKIGLSSVIYSPYSGQRKNKNFY